MGIVHDTQNNYNSNIRDDCNVIIIIILKFEILQEYKMWHRHKWENAVGKMASTDLLNERLP